MQTDWLASDTIFYNTASNKYSKNINELIDFGNFDWHWEGLYNYLDFGYSVLEQTPIKNIKFLRHSSSLVRGENGKLDVNYHQDPAEKWQGIVSHEDDILHLLQDKIKKWEKSTNGEIILPTSGGYDSRILNLMIEDKSRIRSFTYGLSQSQKDSYEVVHAKKIAEILGTKWEQISLGYYHKYFDEWYDSYGISTHAHGMYHIEFYHQMKDQIEGNNHFLSGIIGDAWAGSVSIDDLSHSSDLKNLGYTHGLRADPEHLHNKNISSDIRNKYFGAKDSSLKQPFWKTIESMRLKIILLNYLVRIPQKFGFHTFAPFLDIDLALGMLTLPNERRKDRIWQKKFFERQNLDLESMNLDVSYENNLNFQSSHLMQLQPLSEKILSEIIQPNYIKWINDNTFQKGMSTTLKAKLSKLRYDRYIFRMLPKYPFNISAYNAYLTLYPIQKIIIERDEYFRKK